ncbi:MBL fold metallo-hydrolase [Sporomusa malonica]|uniref:L-ascorbate metabolism protein UlaG, beta-lactamase superfamily n=1 Tax=Sporomusa malonica TaxID=112901 RepID=A0A1W1ZLE9_9FIRM|nr:MBL fold metallo-hydrolase [Sporomusa malonica]SMC49246.1 L-ascorbate metabolism protein UlaG, beta-lactamase superfamily [Sporomusa malonica]
MKSKFINQIPTPMGMDVKKLATTLKDFVKGNPQGRPDRSIPVEPLDTSSLLGKEQTRIIWFGHSTVLLEMEGKRVLLDPTFARTPSPFPLFGGKRYSETLPIELEDLPPIDIVLLSHDHYDHLDYGSITKLKAKVSQFYVPLGVGSHLARWGIAKEKIKEHDWWNESEIGGLRLVAAPARHFSGRGLFDRNTTLWCSWVIEGKHSKVYFSGDSGYGPHFKEIGEKYGPFDLTLMECGQYNERWSTIHMMPEETVQAHLDVKGNLLIPIHWAAFSLALHDWTEPIERITKRAKEGNTPVSTPKIGEAVVAGAAEYPKSIWWK